MALRWRKDEGGVRYEVRTAGRTVRLYTNGVLHTQYNPGRLLTGSVWDLLLLGALAAVRGPAAPRVLVLGVGGGAVINQLLQVFPDAEVTGVELNAVHLAVARRHFGLRRPGVTLVHDNAITWLAMHEGEPFDLVIDDLFGDDGGVPRRAVEADADWFDLLATHLAPSGSLVLNFAGARDVSRCAWRHAPGLRRRFRSALSLSTPTCENRVVTFLPRPVSAADLHARVAAEPALRDGPLRYAVRRLS